MYKLTFDVVKLRGYVCFKVCKKTKFEKNRGEKVLKIKKCNKNNGIIV